MIQATVKLVTKSNNSKKLLTAVTALTKRDVLVGFPAKTARRKGDPMTNAAIAYVQDNGSPLRGIPQREFMRPGIKDVQDKIVKQLEYAGEQAFNGDTDGVERGLHRAGLSAQVGIRAKINSNIQPPLAPATIAARRRRGHKSTRTEVETAQMRNAVEYVVRDRR